METVMETVRLGIGKILFWENDELHNNISIICGDGVKVKGNSLLLASISPWLYKLFKEQCHEEEITIITPDIQSENVGHLMRTIKTNLTSDSDIQCIIDENTFMTLLQPNSEIKLPFCKVNLVEIKCENEEFDLKEDGSTQNAQDLVTILEFDNFNSSTDANDEIEPKTISNLSQILGSSLPDTLLITKQTIEKTIPINLINATLVKKKGKGRPKNNSKAIGKEPKNKGGRPKKDPTAPPKHRSWQEYRNSFPVSKLCPFCGEEFKTEKAKDKCLFAYHVKKHKLDQFSCDCQETWDNKTEKERHMKVKHMGWSQCNQCLEVFSKENSLLVHKENKHSESANNSKSDEHAVCHQCGKGFPSKDNLKVHMQCVHTKEIAHCDECGKDFEGPYRLQYHIKSVHRPKQCPICGTVVKRLRLHMHSVHKEDKDKNHVCYICGKGFLLKNLLDCHNMNVHIKTRPFNCRYGCTFSYNDRSNRNSHEKKKHGGLFTDEN